MPPQPSLSGDTLHVIEPTLVDATGHCFSFVASLCASAPDYPMVVWCDRSAQVSLPANVSVRPYFWRRIRRIQAYFLYRELLRKSGRIFISTATRSDMLMLQFAALGRIPSRKVFLYVHWFTASEKKLRQLCLLAAQQPNLVVFAPTESVVNLFREVGFSSVQLVPYPITALTASDEDQVEVAFRHLLFAGAAREDKGFGHVVDLVALLASRGVPVPVVLQTSAQHYDKYDDATRRNLQRLDQIKYVALQRHPETLKPSDYHALYQGAICLQLYSQQAFNDRISGVTLDALSMSCPVITLEGTWMARLITEFGAGVVLASPDPEGVLEAVNMIVARYDQYQAAALRAGQELQRRNSASLLAQELLA